MSTQQNLHIMHTSFIQRLGIQSFPVSIVVCVAFLSRRASITAVKAWKKLFSTELRMRQVLLMFPLLSRVTL